MRGDHIIDYVIAICTIAIILHVSGVVNIM